MSNFPSRCDCPNAGHCDAVGRVVSETYRQECQANNLFRLMLAKVPRSEWPLTTTSSAPSKACSLPLVNCEHYDRSTIVKTGNCADTTWYACAKFDQCRPHIECQKCRFNLARFPETAPTWTPAQVAEQIAGPEADRGDHEAWCRSPVVKQAHIDAMRSFINSQRDCDEPRDGRGVVLVGGGPKYEPGIYLHIRLLREFGCTLPVQVWHRGEDEPVSDVVRALGGVAIIDATTHPARSRWRVLAGWPLKMIAVLWSGWREVMFSDADNYPVSNPEVCFDHNPTGAVLSPDQSGCDINCKWHSFGIEPPTPNRGTNGGLEIFDVVKVWRALWLSHWFDMHREFYYQEQFGVGGYGEQDARRAAFVLTNTPYHLYAPRPLHFHDNVFVQAGPDSVTPMWVHRISDKPRHQPRKRLARLPMENRFRDIMREYGVLTGQLRPRYYGAVSRNRQ